MTPCTGRSSGRLWRPWRQARGSLPLGLLSWSVWEVILRLWPILLIAIGLDILLGRRWAWGSWLVAAIVLGLLLIAVGLFTTRPPTNVNVQFFTILTYTGQMLYNSTQGGNRHFFHNQALNPTALFASLAKAWFVHR